MISSDCLGLAYCASADQMFVKRKREEKMKAIAITAMAAAAGLATASPISAGNFAGYTVDTAGSPTVTMTIDISGITNFDAQGSALNTVISVALGAGAEVTGLGWDVTLTSFGASWGSEAVMNFGGQIFVTAGVGDDFSVSNMSYSSGGILDLTDNALPNIVTDGAGNLDIEFFESFVDNAGAGDSIWEQGSFITLAVKGTPTPGSLAVLGLGGLVAGRRRR